MKRVIVSLISVLFAVSAICLAFLSWAGLFSEIKISEEKAGPFFLAYDVSIGPYRKSADVMDKIYNTLLGEKGVSATMGFGLYYDKPETVPEKKLRSISGCVVEKEYQHRLQAPSPKFRTGSIPESNAIVARFPYNGKISILIGIFRVYPQLSRYTSEKELAAGPVLELYDVKNGSISYIIPGTDKSVLEALLAKK